MYDILARSFHTAARTDCIDLRDLRVRDPKSRKPWPWRGGRWAKGPARSVDLSKL